MGPEAGQRAHHMTVARTTFSFNQQSANVCLDPVQFRSSPSIQFLFMAILFFLFFSVLFDIHMRLVYISSCARRLHIYSLLLFDGWRSVHFCIYICDVHRVHCCLGWPLGATAAVAAATAAAASTTCFFFEQTNLSSNFCRVA